MLHIKRQEQNAIYYSCTCGANGVCSFKPMDRDAAIVLDLCCPVCQDTERITVLQYSNDLNKKRLVENLRNIDLSWVPFINEELLTDEPETED